MRTPESVYRGLITEDGRYWVTVDGASLPPKKLPGRSRVSGFAWGYSGEGPTALAYALVLDATGDRYLAACSCRWVQWALCVCWGRQWSITAAQVREWVEDWRQESRSLRLREELYEWCEELGPAAPPAVSALAAAVGGLPPGPPPRARSTHAGRIRLYPEPQAIDAPEGGGV